MVRWRNLYAQLFPLLTLFPNNELTRELLICLLGSWPVPSGVPEKRYTMLEVYLYLVLAIIGAITCLSLYWLLSWKHNLKVPVWKLIQVCQTLNSYNINRVCFLANKNKFVLNLPCMLVSQKVRRMVAFHFFFYFVLFCFFQENGEKWAKNSSSEVALPRQHKK